MLQPLSLFDNSGYNLLEDNWDYAIVLDACRYDITDGIEIYGQEFEKRKSPASATMEWISRCITKPHKDMVILAGNPYLSNSMIKNYSGISQPFHSNIPIWKNYWNDEFHTATPWKMKDVARKALLKYPDKRIIFWFMQPHHPFIGFNPENVPLTHDPKKSCLKGNDKSLKVWEALNARLLKKDDVWDAYVDNLKIAIQFGVKEIIDCISGDIIITSDHGNCFGELGIYAHPQRVHIKPLVEVPFMRIQR